MRTYAKVFGDIRQSSIWAEDSDTRIIWITMLTMSDPNGIVRATAPGISHEARVPLAKTREALTLLESPDPESRTLEHDGRRIERVDGGYVILNYLKYRELQATEQRREQTKARVQAYRDRHAGVTGRNGSVTQCNAPVTPGNACNAILDTDTDTDTDQESSPPPPPLQTQPEIPNTATPTTPGKAQEILTAWNTMAQIAGLPTVRSLTSDRKKTIAARLKEPEWRDSWQEALTQIPQSSFLTGSNDRGWKADFDFFMRPGSVSKILEGKYGATPTQGPKMTGASKPEDSPEFQRLVQDYLSGNPHQSYSEAVEVIRQTDQSYRRPPLKVRIAEYRAQHPDASYLDAIERVGSPAEVADYMQHLRAKAASSREPGQVESVAGVLDSLGVKLPPQAEEMS